MQPPTKYFYLVLLKPPPSFYTSFEVLLMTLDKNWLSKSGVWVGKEERALEYLDLTIKRYPSMYLNCKIHPNINYS